MVDISDENLIQQLLSPIAGLSQKAWQSIYKNCYPAVRAMVIKHSGTEQDAIDIFQDGLLIFNRNLKTAKFRGESSIKTYVFSICKNLWIKEFQKKQKQLTIDSNALDTTQEDFNYIKNVDVVTQLMDKLQEDCRKILIEYYYNNKSMAELKDIFNVNSVQAAKNKKWRCLGYLVKLFKEKGITSMEMVDHE